MSPRVSLILPTTARRPSLLDALDSVMRQSEPVQPIVVVNGPSPDPTLLAELTSRRDIVVHREERASLPYAIWRGRQLVQTPYFAFIDDDDLYLPGAIECRLELIERTRADLAVTNGIVKTDSGSYPLLGTIDGLECDPLDALLSRGNWLASSGGLYRSATIPSEYFGNLPAYAEWTYLGVRLAAERKRIVFSDEHTFQIHKTVNSLSDSWEYLEGQCTALDRMENLDLPTPALRSLQQKRVNSWHALAESYLRAGRRGRAWSRHLRSLALPGGYQYLPFTRHLLTSTLAL